MEPGRLHLGMPTLIELPDLAANVDLCQRLGLSFIEFNTDLPANQPDALPADALAGIRRQHGLDFTLHLPEKLDLGAFQGDIRQGHLACAMKLIEWAGQAGMTKATMHLNPGVYFTLPAQRVWLYEKHQADYLANLTGSMDRLVEWCRRCGVLLLVDNLGHRMPFVSATLAALLARYNKGLGLTWDVGHDAAVAYGDSPFIRQHLDRVAHMHLHDFDGKSAHQPLMTGSVDVRAFLDIARTHGLSVVLETKTPEALAASVANLRSAGIITASRYLSL
jgi:sugar phosphate isomerase/epimerase